MTTIVKLYTDGACRGNPGVGGWGVLMRYGDHEKTLKGYEAHTTNNRMEITAVLEGLRALKRACEIHVYTDSMYVKNGITEWVHNWQTRGWKTANKKPVKNADLWQALLEETHRHKIEWHWVKGHSGHVENERADQLANEAIDEMQE